MGTDIASKVYVGIVSCVFTPTGGSPVTILEVSSVVKSEGGSELFHQADTSRWATWEDEVDTKTSIVVNVKSCPELNALVEGDPGALVWRCKARNGTSQKDRIYTASYARFHHYSAVNMSQGAEATGSMIFSARSEDGDTEPVGVADPT
jgi:hypothetical protein